MNQLQSRQTARTGTERTGERAEARLVVLGLAFFLAGAAASALWFSRKPSPDTELKPAALGGSTEAVLQHLDSPVEIRFYSMLDPASVPASMKAYAERVEQLLAKYQQEGKGKIKVTRYDSQSNSNANAAVADGIKPFNADKGDACFLGISVVRNGQKETIPYLSPDWEQALEPDLTRALARAEGANPQAPPVPVPQPDSGALEALKQAIPDVNAVSLEEGTKILGQSGMNALIQVSQEMDAKIKAAEQTFTQAQNNQSEADQQAAREQIRQLQAEQAQKLKQVIASSQAQLQAFQQLKTAPR